MGILFLAGGGASLRRDPVSIGALIISFCPKFPMRTVDNQYHLQALRHLYVLAVEWRSLVTVDVDTKQSVAAHALLCQQSHRDKSTELFTPCLLPELTSFDEISIDDPRFCSFKALRGDSLTSKLPKTRFNREDPSLASSRNIIFVKQRNVCSAMHNFVGISGVHKLKGNVLEIRCLEAMRKSPLFSLLLTTNDAGEVMTFHKVTFLESLKHQLFEYIAYGNLPSDAGPCKDLASFLIRFSLLPHHQWQFVDQGRLQSVFEVSSNMNELGMRLAVMSALYRISRP